MRMCIKCHELKPPLEFNFKNRAKNRRNARCKDCTRRDIMSAYYKKREYYLRYRAKLNLLKRKLALEFIYKYLCSHPCVDCGIQDPAVLQFDHVRGIKEMEISTMSRNRYSIKRIEDEMSKCEVRCANCHARKTARERGYFTYTKTLAIAKASTRT